jgi:hypothetical protein
MTVFSGASHRLLVLVPSYANKNKTSQTAYSAIIYHLRIFQRAKRLNIASARWFAEFADLTGAGSSGKLADRAVRIKPNKGINKRNTQLPTAFRYENGCDSDSDGARLHPACDSEPGPYHRKKLVEHLGDVRWVCLVQGHNSFLENSGLTGTSDTIPRI